jgi:hypothetical protein
MSSSLTGADACEYGGSFSGIGVLEDGSHAVDISSSARGGGSGVRSLGSSEVEVEGKLSLATL